MCIHHAVQKALKIKEIVIKNLKAAIQCIRNKFIAAQSVLDLYQEAVMKHGQPLAEEEVEAVLCQYYSGDLPYHVFTQKAYGVLRDPSDYMGLKDLLHLDEETHWANSAWTT